MECDNFGYYGSLLQSELTRLKEEVRTRVSELSLHNEQELRTEREENHKKQEHFLGRLETDKRQLQLRLQREETERGEEKRDSENRLTHMREQVLRLETCLEQSKKETQTYSTRYSVCNDVVQFSIISCYVI